MDKCKCAELLLWALDEHKASVEYAAKGETEKSRDEARHYADFKKRLAEQCPKHYGRVLKETTECQT